ncbi:4'-phosphopantetheinyl transferase Npt [Roseivivax sp. THAF40]|uniref:4'-phosphopantetheinyl transferase family protein n=1 Tax=unclassified Roseivivax TaxID=2639302 RepID=UPI0012AAA5A0|nr:MULTISPECIES: 4'-phosphopantetheinyl transferase superfamily protein [unclassified Roseivivax]QFS84590.1 4'-phosphopantetheinyl transferase Npt [Roseivivax sp. THAF197b]QFT48417.1 4'-phosphopantetheinyl transferase Npt [Roseivivax sp. THAF40]
MSSMPLLQMIKGLGDAWPDGVAVAVVDPEQVTEPLFPIEEAAVSRAVAGRRAEFAAGRQAARQALKALGYAPVAIPMAEDRAPVWPQGIVGSLSHCPAACIAVVAEAARIASLGVDIEPYDPLPEDIVHEIGREDEIAGIGPDRRLAARQLFSAKEAAYKAQYPLTRTLFGFEGLRYDSVRRTLRFSGPVPPFAKGDAIPVTQWTGDGLCLSLSVLHAGSRGAS